jgi:hypothetical protein
VSILGPLTFQRSLLESTVLWFFNLRVVNVQTFALWVLLGFLDVREGRPGVFRDKVYWWIGFFVDNHGYWEFRTSPPAIRHPRRSGLPDRSACSNCASGRIGITCTVNVRKR